MSNVTAHIRRLLDDCSGTVLVRYSSLVLLIAIAALALMTNVAALPE